MSTITMRSMCGHCGNRDGHIDTRGGQDCVFCNGCGRFQYNAPRSETGREVRSLRTRPDLAVGQRTRILDRDGGRCVLCRADDRPLDVGHLVSVAEGRAVGLTDEELFSDENLAAMCAPCNSGYGARSVNPRLFAATIRIAITRSQQKAG